MSGILAATDRRKMFNTVMGACRVLGNDHVMNYIRTALGVHSGLAKDLSDYDMIMLNVWLLNEMLYYAKGHLNE